MGGSSAPSMNLRMAKIVTTLRFLANMAAESTMARRARTDHSRALLTELTTIIMGTVSKKSSSMVWMRYRFSRVIRLNLTSGALNRTQNLWWMTSTPESSLLYMAKAKMKLRPIFLQRSLPVRMSECCPMYRQKINRLQSGCVTMKIQHAFEAELDVNSAESAHRM